MVGPVISTVSTRAGGALPPTQAIGSMGNDAYVAVALIYVVVYYQLVTRQDVGEQIELRLLLLAMSVPLLLTFVGLVLQQIAVTL